MRVMHLDGSSDPARVEDLPALLAELDGASDDEPDVGAGDPYGWFVTAYSSGTVVLAHAARPHDPELVLSHVPRDQVLTIFTEVLRGDMDAVRARPWVEE
ncbi:hypothetical protein HDC34_000429 [Pseudoclavibacter sp. JAI123]|uniref:hypothetical protein n=1 Tax=Pseudoclavibacter sp. JAI123 TaxID=2723065 RepID=UPI0015CA5887|nr:hypothetical protein [Pseudoclavibacter sp. JAI123]NYF12135.1 hypothetical protein [Pseudoclavibacter sp. JAI123]